MEQVAFVIPTLNEASSIGKVLDRIPVGELREEGYDTSVYVIDGLSVDNTRDIAAEKGAQLVLEKRKGKGIALQTAFESVSADYVIVSDGDNTYPLDVTPEMVRLLQTNDVVIGSRLKGSIEPGAMTRLNVVGNILLTVIARLLFNAHISDVCSGLWGYRGHAIRGLELSAEGFAIEADMFVECARNGFCMAELPITYRARGASRAKLSSLRDGLKIAAFLFKKRLNQTTARNVGSQAKDRGEHG
jgi:glycosyltransferase involved in cell wall biosynthesis